MADSITVVEELLEACEDTPDTNGFVRGLLSRVGDKWSIMVIATLAPGRMRFTQLQKAVPGISHRMLAVTLRSLTVDGLVDRESFGEVPPRVEYRLTPLGETLLVPVLALIDWAGEHRDEVEANRVLNGVPVAR